MRKLRTAANLTQFEASERAGLDIRHWQKVEGVWVEQGHGPAFGKMARAIGLEGKLTAADRAPAAR
jgi:hypothetical protein